MKKCVNCGAQAEQEEKFCRICGTKFETEAFYASSEKADPEEAAPDGAGSIQKRGRLWLWIVLAIVAVVAAIVVCILLGGGSGSGGRDSEEKEETRKPKWRYAYYLDADSSLYQVELSGKKDPQRIGGDASTDCLLSDDGERLFYLADYDSSYSLYYVDTDKPERGAVEIREDVSDFCISPRGDEVYYIRNDSLYHSDLKESKKIDTYVFDLLPDEDGKGVYYYDYDFNLHYYDGEGIKTISGSDGWIIYENEETGESLYMEAGDRTLYLQKEGREPQLLMTDVWSVPGVYEGMRFYYLTGVYGEGELYYYNGKKSVQLASDVVDYQNLRESPMIGYRVWGSTESYYAIEDKVEVFDLDDVAYCVVSPDESKVLLLADAYKDEGTLYQAAIRSSGLGKLERLGDDVSKCGFLDDGTVYYFMDMYKEHGTLFIDGKEVDDDVYYRYMDKSKVGLVYFKDVYEESDRLVGDLYVEGKCIAQDVPTQSLSYQEDEEQLVFMEDWDSWDDSGTLCCYDGKLTQISQYVHYGWSYQNGFMIIPDGKVLFLYDYDGESGQLCCYDGKDVVSLAEDVSWIAYPYPE